MITILCSAVIFALTASETTSVSLQDERGTLARAVEGESTNTFSTQTPAIYLRWSAPSLPAGAKIRCVWIAEDVGKAAPANYHVDETSFTTTEIRSSGTFTLSKPKTDWPEGKYRAEVFVGTRLALTLPFTIEKLRGD